MAEDDVVNEEGVNGEVTATANGAGTWPLIMKLRKPVIANGEEVNELKFREPTPADVESCGDPVTWDLFNGLEQPVPIYNVKAMSAMMSRLAAVPPSTIKALHIKDWEFAKYMLTGPFAPF
jgi:hypothetical protein